MRFIKPFNLFCLLFLLYSLKVDASWIKTNGPAGGDITFLAVKDSTIFAGTQRFGIVYHSNNNGDTWSAWEEDETQIGVSAKAITFISNYIIAVGGRFPFLSIGRSIDNGKTWTTHQIDSSMYYTIEALAANNSKIFVGFDYGIFSSEDYGITWSHVCSTQTPVYYIATDGNVIFAASDAVYRSLDNGSTWKIVNDTYVHSIVISGTTIFTGAKG